MTQPVQDTQVAIIGGGPAGLTAGILLAKLGIDAQIYERRSTTSRLPRAHLLNQRTMEIFESIGVAEDIYALSPPQDRWHRVGWYTSLSGKTPGQGKEIGHQQAWGGGTDQHRYAAASPAQYANVPQMRLDPLLRRHAETKAQAHFDREVTGIRQFDGYVELDVQHLDSGEHERVTARYVIAADGGRLCADLLGVEMIGPRKLLNMVTMHVTADLRPYVTDDEVLLYYFIDPHGRGTFRGSICAMGPDTWGGDSREWAFHQAFAWGDPAAEDEQLLKQGARDMLGIPDLPFDVHVTSRWEFEGVTATAFREGDVFLVGNAAHRHPPTGGLGLNAAVQDVHNLAWKLALVLRGQAGDALLDTYHAERRPVDEFNVNHSLRNAGGHRRIAEALGLSTDTSIEQGWEAIEVWLSDTPEGDARRAAVAEAVASNADDYGQLNVEVGFAYEFGALIPDGTDRPVGANRLRDYVPATRPGHHLPHCWLDTAHGKVSTIHAVPVGGFALFTTAAAAEPWRRAAAAAASSTGIQLMVVVVADSTAVPAGREGAVDELEVVDCDGSWAAVRGTGSTGAVLVRPDWHVAWRVQQLPADASHALIEALGTVLATAVQVSA